MRLELESPASKASQSQQTGRPHKSQGRGCLPRVARPSGRPDPPDLGRQKLQQTNGKGRKPEVS